MTTFETLNLPTALVEALKNINITAPTPIQARAIPIGLEGKDILASAQTGTGKTLAYALPMITKLLNEPESAALILVPTRELAVQVRASLALLLSKAMPLKMAVLIGGEPMMKQFMQLRARPRIIIGTPGRINDHLARNSVNLKETNFVVIDEADRMLDMGFGVQLDKIVTYLPKVRQTVMFSATLLPAIIKVADKYLKSPTSIKENPEASAAPKIKQEIIHTSAADKFGHLLHELNQRDGSVIVFVKTKRGADHLADKLRQKDQSADAIHGDLRQRQRDRVIHNTRENRNRILVATDIAARGLDIPQIRHVINYDLPHCAEDYIHRIGRTARAGMEGNALCLISPEDNKYWKAIDRLMNPGQQPERQSYSTRPANRPSNGGERSERRSGGGGDRSYSERRPSGDRPGGERRPSGDRPYGDRPSGERSGGERSGGGFQGPRKPFKGRAGDGPQKPEGTWQKKAPGEASSFKGKPAAKKPFKSDAAKPDRSKFKRTGFR
ncbi:DEAD/DEAH box helicase [Candidatus Finniella inopinata]|uniref:DEAD/DEAH box helicase n=1 Tax=Candidatus Finniella inopinata TaxID=1696036 RepID=A0A4V2DZP0_9PROT|nr:DEAD/DEAH box helicase [Candidatus Finniella inopinata]RZI45727.1 DEAD/DEAH box helicase [Candidatus Finniella inopinata]